MKTYGATELLNDDGSLRSTNPIELAQKICEVDARTAWGEHEAKLARIEIGIALRTYAIHMRQSLTQVIVDLGICKTENRAVKTFLKYARIAGSESMLELAESPQVSLSVLDEISASKKPAIPSERGTFMQKVCEAVREVCKENAKEEEGAPGGGLVALGITRNEAVGIIRRTQIEMGVPTKIRKKGETDETEIHSKLLQLVQLYRVYSLPMSMRAEWLLNNRIEMSDVGASIIALQDDLVEAGIVPRNAMETNPRSIKTLHMVAVEAMEVIA